MIENNLNEYPDILWNDKRLICKLNSNKNFYHTELQKLVIRIQGWG